VDYLKLYRKNIEFRIDSIREYNSFVEENIEKKLSGIQKKFEKAKIEYDEYKRKNPNIEPEDDYMIGYFDDLSYDHSRIQDNVILKHRNAIIFQICSLVESELYSFAKHNSLKINVFSIDDLKGNSPFEKFKMYVSKTNQVLYKSIEEELEFFDQVRILRNFITHSSNAIRSNNTHFKKIKEFSLCNYEIKELAHVYKENIITYIIKLNNRKFIETAFNKLDILFDKMYLE